jgi:triacylglycerol lipase
MKELTSFVVQVLKATRRRKVALVGSSRGGNAIRAMLKNGGADMVSHAVLCGTPNKGIVISDQLLVGSEFNGAFPFLKGLNEGPDDLIPGVEMMAIRSDKNDKYSQPDGRFIGAPGKPTGVSYDASELRGARNVILEGLDHREVAFHKLAFAAMFEHITGKPPGSMFIAQEPLPILNGRVSGLTESTYTNIPMAGAEVEIFEVDSKTGERKSVGGAASQDHWRGWGLGPVRRPGRCPLRVRAARRRPAHDAHLPLAVPALERTWCISGRSPSARPTKAPGRSPS